MLACWALDNIKEQRSFYKEFDFLMMFSSVVQWKKHHPDHTCRLYCDELTKKVITEMKADRLWDEISVLGRVRTIDKSVFWAASKLQAIRFIGEPFIIMDNDFITYRSFSEFFKSTVIVAHEEDTTDYYPTIFDPYIKQTKHILHNSGTTAINCSFLYFPDPKVSQSYAKLSIQLMEEFTKIKAPNSKYLIYSEQLALKHLLDEYKVKYQNLDGALWSAQDGAFTDREGGLLPMGEEHLWYRHYWTAKPHIYNSTLGYSLEKESEQLHNVLRKYQLNWEVVRNVNSR